MLLKEIELNCEGFDYFRPRSNISRVIQTKYLDDYSAIYHCLTVDNREIYIHETSKPYAEDAYVTTLKIYDSEKDIT